MLIGHIIDSLKELLLVCKLRNSVPSTSLEELSFLVVERLDSRISRSCMGSTNLICNTLPTWLGIVLHVPWAYVYTVFSPIQFFILQDSPQNDEPCVCQAQYVALDIINQCMTALRILK